MPPYQINNKAVTAAAPPPPPLNALHGRSLSLLPLSHDDYFDELYKRAHGTPEREAVWRFMPYGPFADTAQMRDCYLKMGEHGDPQFYCVRHGSDNTIAGVVSYLRIAPAAYCIEIGHIWHAVGKQRGIANTEAAFLLTDNAFSLGYRRVEWKCNALNQRSRQAALRLGFAFEGVFRQHAVFKNHNRDSAWFAILDSEWPALRKNFVTWLDTDGNKPSLTKMNQPLIAWSLPAHDAWR